MPATVRKNSSAMTERGGACHFARKKKVAAKSRLAPSIDRPSRTAS